MLGLYPFEVRKGAVELVKNSIRVHPSLEPRIAAVGLAMSIEMCEAKRGGSLKEEKDVGFDLYFWMVRLWAAVGLNGLVMMTLAKIKQSICSRRTPARNLEIWMSESGTHYRRDPLGRPYVNQNCSGLAGARRTAKKKYCKKCVPG